MTNIEMKITIALHLYSIVSQLFHVCRVRYLEIVEISQVNCKVLMYGSHIGMQNYSKRLECNL